MSLNRVVLPAPLRPTTASVSPAATVNERSVRAGLSAPGYANVTCSKVISPRSGWGTGFGVPETGIDGSLAISSTRLFR